MGPYSDWCGMLSKSASLPALRGLFRKSPVADLETLLDTLETRSPMSVFRRLRDLGYYSSYTHNGRYYTLVDVPEFDEHGLWRYQAIGFSQRGTLKATVAWCVEEANAGCTHGELRALLRVRVHNTLLGLVRAKKIRRETVAEVYLYLSTDQERAGRQLDARHELLVQTARPPRLPPDEVVLLVLVEALHASEGLPAASVVAARLAARGQGVEPEQVQRVYDQFGLEPGKKTAEPP